MKGKAASVCLGILASLLFVAEIHAKHVSNVTNKIGETIVSINEFDMSPKGDNSFVYLHTRNVLYSSLLDADFNLQINAGYFQRKVEYCQWEEIKKVEKEGDNEVTTFTYKKGWHPQQIDSLEFNEAWNYVNPEVQPIKNEKIKGLIRVGSYDISSNLTHIGRTVKLIPNMNQISAFTQSNMQRIFRYIGNGVFYHEFQQGESQILVQQFGYNFNGELPPNEMNRLFETCSTGDIRVTFHYWAPEELSVVGYREGSVIQSRDSDGVSIGSLSAGNIPKHEMIESHKSESVTLVWIARVLYIIFAVIAVKSGKGSLNLMPLICGFLVSYFANSSEIEDFIKTQLNVFLAAAIVGCGVFTLCSIMGNGKVKYD